MTFSFRVTPIMSAIFLAFAGHAQAQVGVFSSSIEQNGTVIRGPVTASAADLSVKTVDVYVGSNSQFYNSVAKSDVLTGEVAVRSVADGQLNAGFASDSGSSGFFAPESVNSRVTWSAVISNNSDQAQQVNFSFYVPEVDLGVSRAYTGYVDGAYQGDAGLNAKITWGSADVWGLNLGVQAQALNDNGNPNASSYVIRADTSRAPNYTTGVYSPSSFPLFAKQALYGNPYEGSLDLGTLASGESRTLSYEMESSAFYSVNAESDSGAYGGLAWAGAVDPFSINRNFVVTVSAVPEPQTYALLLAGVLVIGGVARSRRYSSLHA